uniref:1-phosphatidylinositol-5-phosphate 4-kinase n=1 Tax=Strigamia maritima TaxID=126957 RepID=T1JNX9_STRMM
MAAVTTASCKIKKKLKVKHQKVKLFRANEPLLSVFMWGVNHTIRELAHVSIPVMLMPDDFKAYSKIKVDNHFFNKENMPSHFKVKEYCPLVFRNIRERFQIDDTDFRYSLSKYQPLLTDSTGRSSARLFFSWDGSYFIKTLTSEEVEQMHYLLKQYHPYIVERHGKTLLPQYLGMYRLTVEGTETYVVVSRHVFSNHLTIHRKYDLKGSTVDREASDKEKEKELPMLKDNDFVREGVRIHIGDNAREKLLQNLNADVEFLSKLNMMDYSLLLGIHDNERAEQEEREREEEEEDEVPADNDDTESQGSGKLSPPDSPQLGRERFMRNGDIDPKIDIYALPCSEHAPRKEIYFMGLIDVLTNYGIKKRTAQAAKTVKHGAGAEISTVHPEQYGRRFLDFISKAIE